LIGIVITKSKSKGKTKLITMIIPTIHHHIIHHHDQPVFNKHLQWQKS